MQRWITRLMCCALTCCLVAPAAWAEAAGNDALKAKYEAARKEADLLRSEMSKLRHKYDKDPEVAAAQKDAYAARKAYDEKVKSSAAIAEARKAVDAARKQLDGQVEAAMAADPQAGPVLKKYQEATKRIADLREELKKLETDRRKLQSEVYSERRRVSRDREVAKDARKAVADAEKAYRDAVKADTAVQAADKVARDAQSSYEKARRAKYETDPDYAKLVEKAKAVDAEMRDLRNQMRSLGKPKKAE